MALTTIMRMNNGVLRQRDHLSARAAFAVLVRSGAIVRVLPGTFVDAARMADRQTRFAAALAFAPGSLLWGTDAVAALTGTLSESPFGERDHVQLTHRHSRRDTHGVRWVRRRVPVEQRARIGGLRTPSGAYLAVEAAARDEGALIERFLREGRVQGSDLSAALPHLAGMPGQETRRRLVRSSLDNPWSGGERKLQHLLRQNGIGGWVANVELLVGGRRYYPDLWWAEPGLIVEFDGYEMHSRRDTFESDRIRQNELVLAGYAVLRFTWKQVTEQPGYVVSRVRAALARETAPDLSSAIVAEG